MPTPDFFFLTFVPSACTDGVLPPWQIPFCFRASLTVGKLALNRWAAHVFDRQLDLACFSFIFIFFLSFPFNLLRLFVLLSEQHPPCLLLSLNHWNFHPSCEPKKFFFFFFALLISWSKGLTTCTFSHTPMHILVWSIPPPKLSGSFCWNSWQMYSMPLTPAWIFTLPLLLASCAPEHFWHLAWMLCIHHLRAFLVPFG